MSSGVNWYGEIYIYIMNHFSLKLSKFTVVNRETLNIHAVKIIQSVKKND